MVSSTAVGLVLIASACGSSGSSGLSGTALANKAKPICRKHIAVVNKAIDTILNAGGGHPGDPRFATVISDTVVPQYRAMISDLAALKPASPIKADWDTWLSRFRAQVTRLTGPGTPGNTGPGAINGQYWGAVNSAAKNVQLAPVCDGGHF